MPRIIPDATIGAALRRRYGFKGPPAAPLLSEEVQPVVIVDDLHPLNLEELPGGARQYSTLFGNGPDPANVLGALIYNRTLGDTFGSGQERIVRICSIIVDNQKIGAVTTGLGITWGLRAGFPPAAQNIGTQFAAPWGRELELGRTQIDLYLGTLVGGTAIPGHSRVLGRCAVPIDSTFQHNFSNCGVIVPPGWAFSIRQQVFNSDIDVTVEWEEFPSVFTASGS